MLARRRCGAAGVGGGGGDDGEEGEQRDVPASFMSRAEEHGRGHKRAS